ncbi:hypothetical protein CCP3SC15_2450006 [Gammaproteobacteria bacterium]
MKPPLLSAKLSSNWDVTGVLLSGRHEAAAAAFTALIAENHMYTEAYDWLARVYQAAGNFQGAKETLATAAKISSRSIRRAQLLGEVSLRTDDAALAEQAFRSAARLAVFPFIMIPMIRTFSASAHGKRKFKEASRIIKNACKQYHGNTSATLALTILEASNCHQLNYPIAPSEWLKRLLLFTRMPGIHYLRIWQLN